MSIFLGIIVGAIYFFIGFVTNALMVGLDEKPSLFIMIFWPMIVALAIVMFTVLFVYELGKRLRR